MKVSIIIVNYHVRKELLDCIASIYTSKPKLSFEIIVVDNDERKTIGKELKKKFSKIIYIPNLNKGFGQGNNVGASKAKGEYLFFLNPDTEVFPESIDNLVQFLQKKKKAGIVAPLLLGTDGKAYQQGTLELTPKRGIFALSFFNRLFPTNPVSRNYFLLDWDRKSTKEVAVAPGTAFMMKKHLFDTVGRFDEKFFLFFEEFDLHKRIRELGYSIFIYPKAQVKHAWGVSTKQRSDINSIFEKSRFYYFKKHFGLLSALLTETIMRFNKYWALLIVLLAIGAFLRIHHIGQSMPFIGDQGWYYLSARDMVLKGEIPLVGIESSRPWLHQGALWTYMMAGVFLLFGFNPFVGVYISIFLGMLGILGMYMLGSFLFSRGVGVIAAALFATSPLVIASDRMPYHTSPIPLITIIFMYVFYKWIRGNSKFFPFVVALLGILYNLELATALFGITTMAVWLYGYKAKKAWAREVLRPTSLVLGLSAFVLSMLPMLIYDVTHGFPQTLGFSAWLGYKVLLILGFPPINPTTPVPWSEMAIFSIERLKLLLFPYSGFVAVGILIGSILLVSFRVKPRNLIPALFKNKTVVGDPSTTVGMTLVLILNIILIVGLFAARTPSGAYLPMMFAGLLLLVGVGIDWLLRKVREVGVVGVLLLMFFNGYYSYQVNAVDTHFRDKLTAAKFIVKEAEGKEYNLKGRGNASEFESFTMNYEYLTWWLGNGPTDAKQPLQFFISEEGRIKVSKEIESKK